ncbi:uncharacterized protein YdaU (DUF1376 family) [Ochrobactrum sp. RH1CCR137]|nr:MULTISPECIES: DUF1376 domain-containing protein [unclassified Ochrobactrum]MBA8845689.1 uncharacterized protein YdaU (DUF1376 family) [Ochrobactrum sp. RH1CCR137]MBA8857411.1 uncharacterized protein YdaU (DUF1376 family) [Ochrobactrum sp. RH1CCR134]
MSDLVWMKVYIGTEMARTAHLTPEEFGVYERLRRHYWQHGSLPDDADRLARTVGLDGKTWKGMADAIRLPLADALAELDKERTEARLKRDRKIAAGKKGADARWQKDSNTIRAAGMNGNTNAVANGKGMADALAEPSNSQWQNDSHQHQRQIEGRYEERLVPTREREKELEPSEIPYDPPEDIEAGREWLRCRGVSESEIDSKLYRLMNERLYPSDLASGDMQ